MSGVPTVGRDVGMAYGRGIVVALISVLIGFPLGLCGVLTTVAIATAGGQSPWTYVLLVFAWLVPFVLAAIVFVVVVRRRTAKLDAVFGPLGLEGGAYMSFFRQYHGQVYGRQVDVYLRRGPVLQIEVATPMLTRFGVTGPHSDTRAAAAALGKQQLALADPALGALTVFAIDENWMRWLLADTTATDALRRLTAIGSSIFTRQQVLLRPGTLQLMLSGNRRTFGLDITLEQARLWLDDLVRVAQAGEALPQPTVTAELSSAEDMADRIREGNPYISLWAGAVILGFFVVAAIVIFALVFALT